MFKGTIKALGEVNLRVRNLRRMTKFYTDVLGLKPIYESDKHVFLRVANGFEGHTQVVALFNYRYEGGKKSAPQIARTTLDHISFNIRLRDFESEKKRLQKLGLDIREELTTLFFTIQTERRLSSRILKEIYTCSSNPPRSWATPKRLISRSPEPTVRANMLSGRGAIRS